MMRSAGSQIDGPCAARIRTSGEVPASRAHYLTWLAAALEPYGLSARVLGSGEGALLGLVDRSGLYRFVACLPMHDSWAFVWSCGWAFVGDPRVVAMIVEVMT